MLKTPYLSTTLRFLLLVIASLLFGLNHTAHAEGLSGLKDLLNKGKINKSNAPDVPIIPDTVESSNDLTPVKNKRIIDDNVKTPEFTFVNKNRLEGKANLAKNKKEISEKFSKDLINDCNKMLASSKSIEKKKTGSVIAAVRIEDDLDGSIPSQLPEDFFKNIDTDELAIRTDIKNLYDSFEALSLVDFNKTCESLLFRYRNSRADICHLISLIKSDAQLKKDPNSALEKQTIRKLIWPTHFDPIPPYPRFDFFSLYEQYLKINRDTSFGNELTKFVNKEADIRLKKIKKANDNIFPAINNEIKSLNKLKADYEAYVKQLLSLKHIVPGFTSQYENNPDYLQRVMKYAIDDIKSYYLRISQAYIKIAIVFNAAGQWEESMQLTKEYKDYFDKNMPEKFTIKFAGKFDYDAAANSGNLGNLKIIEGDLLINKNNLLWGEKRMDQAAFECVSRLSLQNVTDQFNSAEFRNKIIKFAETNITDPVEIKEYKKEPIVERIYFTESEYSTPIDPKKIFDANERICIKVVLDTYNQFYQRPIEITLKSSVSGRNKIVKTTPRRGNDLPYALFQPNETEDEPLPPPPIPPSAPPAITVAIKMSDELPIFSRNLINRTRNAQKESISVLSGFKDEDGIAVEDGLALYDKKDFFAYRLTRATLKGEDLPNNVVDVSKEFCIRGGEVIYADCRTAKGYVVVANQADWFMIEAHGDFVDGHIEFTNRQNTLYKVTPKELEKKYEEDMDVLILNTCYCLKWTSQRTEPSGVKRWQKVLPQGLIIGYGMSIKPYTTKTIFKTFSENIKNNMEPKTIADLWLKIHADILNEPGYVNYDLKNQVDGAACIINGKYGINELFKKTITINGKLTVKSKYEPKYYNIK